MLIVAALDALNAHVQQVCGQRRCGLSVEQRTPGIADGAAPVDEVGENAHRRPPTNIMSASAGGSAGAPHLEQIQPSPDWLKGLCRPSAARGQLSGSLGACSSLRQTAQR
jgi:hypothetical protein